MGRPANLLIYRGYEKAPDGSAIPKLAYRIVVIGVEEGEEKPLKEKPLNLLSNDEVNSEAATQVAGGTDFRKEESKEEKTLLSFTPSVGKIAMITRGHRGGGRGCS